MSANASQFDTITYHVRQGDSLSRIIQQFYGPVTPDQRNTILGQIQIDNPHIKDANLIYPGQVFSIDIPPQYCSPPLTPVVRSDKKMSIDLVSQYRSASEGEKNLMSSIVPIFMGSGAAALSTIDNTFKANAPVVQELVQNYESFKSGKMTKGQYDYSRSKIVSKLEANLGPTRILSNNNQPLREVLRISRKKGTPPTQAMSNQLKSMGKLSRAAAKGGVIISAASLGLACYDISQAKTKRVKNEIFVEAVGSFVTGLAAGAAATLVVVSMATPIGWVAVLAIGIGTAAVSYGGGQGIKYLYTKSGAEIDVTGVTHVDQLCN